MQMQIWVSQCDPIAPNTCVLQLCPKLSPSFLQLLLLGILSQQQNKHLRHLSLQSSWDHRPLPLGPASYFYLSLLFVALTGSILIPFLSVCILSWKAALIVSCIGVTQPPSQPKSVLFSNQAAVVLGSTCWFLGSSLVLKTSHVSLFFFSFPTPADTAQAFGWLVICLHSYLGAKGCLVS